MSFKCFGKNILVILNLLTKTGLLLCPPPPKLKTNFHLALSPGRIKIEAEAVDTRIVTFQLHGAYDLELTRRARHLPDFDVGGEPCTEVKTRCETCVKIIRTQAPTSDSNTDQ